MKQFLTNLENKLLNKYKKNKQKNFKPSLDYALKSSREMLKSSRYCILITNNDSKSPSARMVQPIVDFKSFEVWLGTKPDLRKVREIEKNQNVTLAFSNNKEHANLIIYGRATIEKGESEKTNHWINSWHMFFPGGPKGNDFVSIRVETYEIEIMNFKKNIVPPEPFGLKPVKIIKAENSWKIE